MMTLFTHGKKILRVKGNKPNFTSNDDLFPQLDRPLFPPRATSIYLKGYKEPRETKEANKKKKRKRGREWEEIM